MAVFEWQTGSPPKSGYYLITWTNGPHNHDHPIVTEAWYNVPDSKKPHEGQWWLTRGYANNHEKSESIAALGHIEQMRPELVSAARAWARENCGNYLPLPNVLAWAPMPKPYEVR